MRLSSDILNLSSSAFWLFSTQINTKIIISFESVSRKVCSPQPIFFKYYLFCTVLFSSTNCLPKLWRYSDLGWCLRRYQVPSNVQTKSIFETFSNSEFCFKRCMSTIDLKLFLLVFLDAQNVLELELVCDQISN